MKLTCIHSYSSVPTRWDCYGKISFGCGRDIFTVHYSQFLEGCKDGGIANNKGIKLPKEWRNKLQKTMFKPGNKSKRKYIPGKCKTSKPIEMLKKGRIVGYFVSINNAAIKTGIQRENISKVLKGERGKAGGFEWEYA